MGLQLQAAQKYKGLLQTYNRLLERHNADGAGRAGPAAPAP